MFINDLCKKLNDAKIPYAIVGGYAVSLHGFVRGTVDVDLVIKWSLKHLQKIEIVLKEMGLVSLLPINSETLFHFRDEYIKERNLIAWNFYDPHNPLRQVDIIVNYDLKDNLAETIKTSGGKIRVLTLAELIKMKKASGRPQDLADVQALESL